MASNGYVIVRVGIGHHLSDVRGYAYEHRMVAEEKLGRRLNRGEQVHHINGCKTDNRPENIAVMSCVGEHQNQHRKQSSKLRLFNESNPMVLCKCGCGEWFYRFDAAGRPREFVTGHNSHESPQAEAFMKACGDQASLREIAERTGQSPEAVKCMASKLVAKGILTRKGRGLYGKDDRHLVV